MKIKFCINGNSCRLIVRTNISAAKINAEKESATTTTTITRGTKISLTHVCLYLCSNIYYTIRSGLRFKTMTFKYISSLLLQLRHYYQ